MQNQTHETTTFRPLFPVIAASWASKEHKQVCDDSWLVNPSFQGPKKQELFVSQQEVSTSETPKRKYEDLNALVDDSDDEKSTIITPVKKKKKHLKVEKKKKKRKKNREKNGEGKTDMEKIMDLERRFYFEDNQPRKESGTHWLGSDEEKKYEKFYFWDTTGDKNNAVFFCLYRLDIPIYYHKPSYCLGLPLGERLYYTTKEGYIIVSAEEEFNPSYVRYSSRSAHIRSQLKHQKRIDLSKPKDRDKRPIGVDEDFVSLETNTQNKETEEVEETLLESLLRKTREFNQKTRENPLSVETWVEFINFQDEFLSLGSKQQKSIGALMEKKISIYQKALETNPRSEPLLLGYLECCQQSWE